MKLKTALAESKALDLALGSETVRRPTVVEELLEVSYGALP